jgi:hypothetical protein
MTLERPLVEKRTDDEVPHTISERTHQSLSKKPTAFGNRLFQHRVMDSSSSSEADKIGSVVKRGD